MELRPILSAMLRNKIGAILVGLQIAITLAVVANAVAIIMKRVEKIGRPPGIDSDNLFFVQSYGFGPNYDQRDTVRRDLDLIRSLPGVVSASPINGVPLSGGGSATNLGATAAARNADDQHQLLHGRRARHGVARRQAARRSQLHGSGDRVQSGPVRSAVHAVRDHLERHCDRRVRRRACSRQDDLRRRRPGGHRHRRHGQHARRVGRLGQADAGHAAAAHPGGTARALRGAHRARTARRADGGSRAEADQLEHERARSATCARTSRSRSAAIAPTAAWSRS